MRSPWIADFRCWTKPELSSPATGQKDRGLWGREWWFRWCMNPARHDHLVSVVSNDWRCVYFFYVVACLKFVQVSYELFFVDFLIFLQCGKGFQVRQQCRSFTDSIRQAKFWCANCWATQAEFILQRVQTDSTKSINRVHLSKLIVFEENSKKWL